MWPINAIFIHCKLTGRRLIYPRNSTIVFYTCLDAQMLICPVSHLSDHAQEYVMPLYLAPAECLRLPHRVWIWVLWLSENLPIDADTQFNLCEVILFDYLHCYAQDFMNQSSSAFCRRRFLATQCTMAFFFALSNFLSACRFKKVKLVGRPWMLSKQI
jgi:hypothetical protein